MAPRSVELRVAGWQFAMALLGIGAVAGYGVVLWVATPDREFAVGVSLLAAVLAAVVVAEWPRLVVFDVDGVERRSLFKRHRIPWGEVDALERLPAGVISSLDSLTTDRKPTRHGLMVRTIRGKVYLLTAMTESADEQRAIQAAVRQWAPYCRMNLIR